MALRRPKTTGAAAAREPARHRPVLVTGFEPFGGEDTNPSWEICRVLPGAIGHARIQTVRVPTEFRRAIEVVAAAIEELEPAVVILLGQAGGRACVSVERVAINVDDARIADNAGLQPIDEPIAAAGPPAYFATVPIKAMLAAILEAGVPAQVSNSAGTFVCNHLFYGTLHFLAASGRDARAGFIHVPWLESQAVARPGEPAMALATMVRGVEAAIAAALATAEDVKMAAGQLD
ncbi:MAG: pyroglutamyl-peptidase I [Burkholderiales bacterium]|nr:pyroglutamyl-peptidase I [Burkholderiales bacterium]